MYLNLKLSFSFNKVLFKIIFSFFTPHSTSSFSFSSCLPYLILPLPTWLLPYPPPPHPLLPFFSRSLLFLSFFLFFTSLPFSNSHHVPKLIILFLKLINSTSLSFFPLSLVPIYIHTKLFSFFHSEKEFNFHLDMESYNDDLHTNSQEEEQVSPFNNK